MSKKVRRNRKDSKPPRLPSWSNGALMLAHFVCYMLALYFGAKLADFGLPYITVADKVPLSEWGWAGWFVTFIVLLVGALACGFAFLGEEFKRTLQDRD